LDPGTLLIICFVIARWLVNATQDTIAVARGEKPPRWEKASSAGGGLRTKLGAYFGELLDNSLDQSAKRHRERHGDRFERWKARRARKKARKAKKREKKATSPTDTKPSAPSPTPTPAPTPTSSTSPAHTPPPKTSTPPASPAHTVPTSSTGGPGPMAGAITVPTGEVTSLEQAHIRAGQWRQLVAAMQTERESAQASVTAWLNALRLAVIALEQTRACLERAEGEGTALAETAKAKEQATRLAELYKQIAKLLGDAADPMQTAGNAFAALEAELLRWNTAADAYRGTSGAAGKKFLTGRGA